jgi:hypothetical protein
MPFRSLKQARWAHSQTGEKALGGPAKVDEWDHATDFKSLPEKSPTHAMLNPKKTVKHGE